MGKVLTAVRKLVKLNKGIMPNGAVVPLRDIPDVLTGQAGEDIAAAAIAAPNEAWEVFRKGTDEEFAVLVNEMGCLGSDFNNDKARREIMSLAKQRGTNDVLEETRAGFGVLFDRFWNEADSAEPVGKARTFGQIIHPPI
jgi:hypothetical protein